jgi:hypothetical protein
MTPKEKAEELYNKFLEHSAEFYEKLHTKECVIICIDEIIKSLEITTGHCELRKLDLQEVQMDFDFWNKVKLEIDKKYKLETGKNR